MSELELCNIDNNNKCNDCNVPLVLENNTDKDCKGYCYECFKQTKIEVMIYAFGNLPIFFNVKDDVLRMKPVRYS